MASGFTVDKTSLLHSCYVIEVTSSISDTSYTLQKSFCKHRMIHAR
jgi:hypothetical protein